VVRHIFDTQSYFRFVPVLEPEPVAVSFVVAGNTTILSDENIVRRRRR